MSVNTETNALPSASRSFAFPVPSPERRLQSTSQRASTGVLRTRRSSPLLHEIQGPSRRLSPHQVLLLTPFGGQVSVDTLSNAPGSGVGPGTGEMARGTSSMGSSRPIRSTGMASQTSSIGMGRDSVPAVSSNRRSLPGFPTRLTSTRHQSLVQPVNPSPLSQPLSSIPSGSEQGSESGSSQPVSREHSSTGDTDGEGRDELGPLEGAGMRMPVPMPMPVQTGTVPMMRSNSLPVLTLRELDAMKDKDGELGISRDMHWAWVSNGEDDGGGSSPEMMPITRTTPSFQSFTFQDPFAPLGTLASTGPSTTPTPHRSTTHHNPQSTEPEYRYSPTAEPRRMSEISPAAWSSSTPTSVSPSGTGTNRIRSRGESVTTITPFSHAHSYTPIAHFSPPLSTASSFNSRASMSAIEQDQQLTFGSGGVSGGFSGNGEGDGHVGGGDSPKGTSMALPAIRPRILRYKTSPARFTGLGLDIVVKAQPANSSSNLNESVSSSTSRSGSGSNSTGSGSTTTANANANAHDRRRSSQRSWDTYTITGSGSGTGTGIGIGGDRRRSSQKSDDQDRRRSSNTSSSSIERRAGGGGVWAVVDVVDTLSTAELSVPSSLSSLSTSSLSTGPTHLHHHPQQTTSTQGSSRSSPRGSVYTIEHVSSRSRTSLSNYPRPGSSKQPAQAYMNLTNLNLNNLNFDHPVSHSEGFTLDPLAYPRRGSLAVLSQTALGPWAARSPIGSGTFAGGGGTGQELLGAPKGDWQERRGSWAEGWTKR